MIKDVSPFKIMGFAVLQRVAMNDISLISTGFAVL